MGNTSFLTGASTSGSQSIQDALYELENCSVIFLKAWLKAPPDNIRAGRASNDAMVYLDHIVNEILRARDESKAKGGYDHSALQNQLDIARGKIANPVTAGQQQAFIDAGPGQGKLPFAGQEISLEKLLNKIKHRHHRSANFRIEAGERHIFFNMCEPTESLAGVDRGI